MCVSVCILGSDVVTALATRSQKATSCGAGLSRMSCGMRKGVTGVY